MREARIHVRHVRDLMKSVDSADAYNGVDCASNSFLNTITLGDILGKLLRIIAFQIFRFILQAQYFKIFEQLCCYLLWFCAFC